MLKQKLGEHEALSVSTKPGKLEKQGQKSRSLSSQTNSSGK
jgi:hypothetical protein